MEGLGIRVTITLENGKERKSHKITFCDVENYVRFIKEDFTDAFKILAEE